MKFRAAFLWDCRGTSTVLWIRTVDLPAGVGPVDVLTRGIWVVEHNYREGEYPFREGPIDWQPDRLSPGAVWIPPGRVTSIIAVEEP